MRRTNSPDRHLQKRSDGGWRYVRRVPGDALAILRRSDPSYPEFVRRSLDTSDQLVARARRDRMEAADDDFWSGVLSDVVAPNGDAYQRALSRAKSLKIEYRPASDIASDASIDEILRRIEMLIAPQDRVLADALIGGVAPETSIDEAFAIFEGTIRKAQLARKSDWQRLKWRQLKHRGMTNFKTVVGDIPIERIGRDEARRFHEWWLGRIVPDDAGQAALSASAGNKDLDTMRALVGEYMAYCGREDVPNPFRGLRFEDRSKASRPAFSREWLSSRILAPGALDGLNGEARLAVLALVNTGARPSEIVNLDRDRIVLHATIPHVDIRETSDRELKAAATARRIPLAGVSLDAMREARDGFPRYRDKDTLSATVNKFLRENGMMETDRHSLYSLRHGFEQRLKLAEVDEELRRYLMGHSIKRPKYGYSEDLRWAASAIGKVAL